MSSFLYGPLGSHPKWLEDAERGCIECLDEVVIYAEQAVVLGFGDLGREDLFDQVIDIRHDNGLCLCLLGRKKVRSFF